MGADSIIEELQLSFPAAGILAEKTRDGIPTVWAQRDSLTEILHYLKTKTAGPYRMLYDLTALDETKRAAGRSPERDFTVIYHLLSYDSNSDVRVKIPLRMNSLILPSITSLWSSANWYEREVWDMFGVQFEGHPHLARILMPRNWRGHPLRKTHYAQATQGESFHLTDEDEAEAQAELEFHPEAWGLKRSREDTDFLFLNLGPHHVGTHGVLRVVLQLDGEEIVDAVPDIGFHHRGAEKMGEIQTWHTYIPYTDRVEYLSGVVNNLPYVMAVEKLAGIQVPDRAQVVRVMLTELFRISSHLVWYGTFAQDVGALSPVFYMFTDREHLFEIIEAICGARMHPNWFRIGGIAQDLPRGWENLVLKFINYLPRRMKEYDQLVMKNRIFRGRTEGIGAYSTSEAIEWGVTGPGLRATGFEWDFRKKRPYSGYDQFDFDIPTAQTGDSYDRALVRVEEIHQSLRIIRQCVKMMPPGPYRSKQVEAAPPLREYALRDIESLIDHFLDVSWGPKMPKGEVHCGIEATKGNNGYYITSDGNSRPYRVRIRAPSFAHMQMLPLMSRGHLLSDLLAILGSMDYVLSDVDR